MKQNAKNDYTLHVNKKTNYKLVNLNHFNLKLYII